MAAVAGLKRAYQDEHEEEESTDFKLAILASLHPDLSQEVLFEALLGADGSVEKASRALRGEGEETHRTPSPVKKPSSSNALGYQASLTAFGLGTISPSKKKLTRRGKTLHLYAPEDVEEHTPCSIIHNFLPNDLADALLKELMVESSTFLRDKFKLFDRVVESPHTFKFYVDSWSEAERQRTEYIYDGKKVNDVAQTTPMMLKASGIVKETVNKEVERRIRERYPDGKKLRFQSPKPWLPNTSFVNCYDGGAESVGYHADQLTYLGPRAIIGSLSLGVAREFRVRKTVAREDNVVGPACPLKRAKSDDSRADEQGQIAIHLPHNSLLIMHAEMQEEWKHSIAPAQAIDPHPIAKNKRLNITYRCYKESLHPSYTPKCKCNVACVLRCATQKKESRGRYMWMCHTGYVPGQEGCSFFQWAEFDDDGEPPWSPDFKKSPTKNPAG